MGNYGYLRAKPHAVTRVVNTDYLITSTSQQITYNPFGKATRLGSTTYGFSPYYYNKDHLGNIREVAAQDGTVQQVTNYYPFGIYEKSIVFLHDVRIDNGISPKGQ